MLNSFTAMTQHQTLHGMQPLAPCKEQILPRKAWVRLTRASSQRCTSPIILKLVMPAHSHWSTQA